MKKNGGDQWETCIKLCFKLFFLLKEIKPMHIMYVCISGKANSMVLNSKSRLLYLGESSKYGDWHAPQFFLETPSVKLENYLALID